MLLEVCPQHMPAKGQDGKFALLSKRNTSLHSMERHIAEALVKRGLCRLLLDGTQPKGQGSLPGPHARWVGPVVSRHLPPFLKQGLWPLGSLGPSLLLPLHLLLLHSGSCTPLLLSPALSPHTHTHTSFIFADWPKGIRHHSNGAGVTAGTPQNPHPSGLSILAREREKVDGYTYNKHTSWEFVVL